MSSTDRPSSSSLKMLNQGSDSASIAELTTLEDEAVESWPPEPPNMTASQMLQVMDHKPFRTAANSHIYRLQGVGLLFKACSYRWEYQMMRLAGDCSVKPRGKVLSLSKSMNGVVSFDGIIMDLETPLELEIVNPSNREYLMRQMISCVETLHSTYGVIHGDFKPKNMLLCSNGKIRLCDFAESRKINEDASEWDGMVTVNYISPTRSRHYFHDYYLPPTVSDDLYSLGLSIWEIYTGKVPLDGEYDDEIIRTLLDGRTVDINLVSQPNVREIIRKYLVQGGATSLSSAIPCKSKFSLLSFFVSKIKVTLCHILLTPLRRFWSVFKS